MPEFLCYNSFMQTIDQQIIILFYKFIIISCSMDFFRSASTISYFPTIYGIF